MPFVEPTMVVFGSVVKFSLCWLMVSASDGQHTTPHNSHRGTPPYLNIEKTWWWQVMNTAELNNQRQEQHRGQASLVLYPTRPSTSTLLPQPYSPVTLKTNHTEVSHAMSATVILPSSQAPTSKASDNPRLPHPSPSLINQSSGKPARSEGQPSSFASPSGKPSAGGKPLVVAEFSEAASVPSPAVVRSAVLSVLEANDQWVAAIVKPVTRHSPSFRRPRSIKKHEFGDYGAASSYGGGGYGGDNYGSVHGGGGYSGGHDSGGYGGGHGYGGGGYGVHGGGPGGGYGALCDCGNLEVIGALAGFGALSALLVYAISSSSSSTTTDDMAIADDTNAFTAQVLGDLVGRAWPVQEGSRLDPLGAPGQQQQERHATGHRPALYNTTSTDTHTTSTSMTEERSRYGYGDSRCDCSLGMIGALAGFAALAALLGYAMVKSQSSTMRTYPGVEVRVTPLDGRLLLDHIRLAARATSSAHCARQRLCLLNQRAKTASHVTKRLIQLSSVALSWLLARVSGGFYKDYLYAMRSGQQGNKSCYSTFRGCDTAAPAYPYTQQGSTSHPHTPGQHPATPRENHHPSHHPPPPATGNQVQDIPQQVLARLKSIKEILA